MVRLQGFGRGARAASVLVDSRHGFRELRRAADRVLGTFACYSHQAGAPDPYIVKLLERAESLARVALESARRDKALRESEPRFRTCVDQSTDAFFLLDQQDGTILDVNEEACRSLGQTRSELLGAKPTSFGCRGPDSMLAEDLARAEKEGVLIFDSWHRRKNGLQFPVEVRIRPALLDGRPLAFAFARDMSERVRAETALRESEKRFRQLAESAFEGLMIHEQGVIRDANQAFARIFGFPNTDGLVGKSCFDVLPLTSASAERVRRQLATLQANPFEIEGSCPTERSE